MVHLLRGLGLLALAPLVAACAEGHPSDPAQRTSALPIGEAQPTSGMPSAPTAGMPAAPLAGNPASSPGPDEEQPAADGYTGESCMQDQPAPCVCEDTGTEGIRRCFYDPESPTMGTLGDTCENCPPAPEPEPEPEPMGTPDAGAPTMPEPEPEPEPECTRDRDCPDRLLSNGCCTDDGVCGTESGLIITRCET